MSSDGCFNEYAETFSVLKSISNERQVTFHWLRAEVLSQLPMDKPLRFLSVGAGPGDFDSRIISELFDRGVPQVTYTAVEPSPVFSKILSERFERDPRVTLELVQGSFDTATLAGHYDFILFSHSLYYLADKEHVIKKAAAYLATGDSPLVLIHQASMGVSQIQKHFGARMQLQRNPGMTSESLLDVFDSIKSKTPMDYSYSVVWTNIDTTDVLDVKSSIGLSLLQFLLDVRSDQLTAPILEEFRQFVRNLSYQHGKKMSMLQPLGIYVVKRLKADAI